MATVFRIGQTASFTVGGFIDSTGAPTTVEALISSAMSDPAVASMTIAADGLSGTVTAVAAGLAQLQLQYDVRFGPDVVPLMLTSDVQVLSGEAVSGVITMGAPA